MQALTSGMPASFWSAWDSVGSAFVIAKSPNSPSARAPWCSAPRDPVPAQGLQNQVSAAAGTRRATSAFQLSRGCLSTRVPSSSQSPRARPQLAPRALTWASPWSCSGVRASPDLPSSEGGRSGVGGRGIGGELDEGGEGQGDRSGYWEKSLYKGGGRGRSSELWRRTSEQSGAGRELRTVPLRGAGCKGEAWLTASTCPTPCSHPKSSHGLP